MEKEICGNCNGHGWISGSRAAHGCDGTEINCSKTCPVEEQTQEGCVDCMGTGMVPLPLIN